LNSVLTQTCQDYEIVVVDNTSTDETSEVLGGIDDPRISVIKVKNNGIIAYSRNIGMQRAKGDWIAFLDSDDVWKPDKLGKVRDVIDFNSEIILVCHDEWHVHNGLFKNRLKYGPAGTDMYERLLFKGNCVSTSAVCLRKDIAIKSHGFSEREDFSPGEDYDYWIRLSQLGEFYFIDEILGEWHIHGNNLGIVNLQKHAESIISISEYHLDLWLNKFPSTQKQVIRGRSKAWTFSSRILQKGCIFSKAIQYAIKAICLNPFQMKAWGVLLLSLLRISSK